MERQTLLFKPTNSAAVTSYARVDAPAGAFGDAQGGLADLGRGISSAAGGIAQIGAAQAERDRRKAQDERLAAEAESVRSVSSSVAVVDAQRAAYAKAKAEGTEFDLDSSIQQIDKSYSEELSARAAARKIPGSVLQSDEFFLRTRRHQELVKAERDDFVNGVMQDRRISFTTEINTATMQDFARRSIDWTLLSKTGELPSSFSDIAQTLQDTRNLTGVPDSARSSLLRQHMESFEVQLPGKLTGASDEQRASVRDYMVSLGWTAERATKITEHPKMDEASKGFLRTTALTLAESGNFDGAMEQVQRLQKAGVPPEDIRGLENQVAFADLANREFDAIRRPSIHSPYIQLPYLKQMLETAKSDTTGTALVSNLVSDIGAYGISTDQFKKKQSELVSVLSQRVSEMEASPSAAIETSPLVESASSSLVPLISGASPSDPDSMSALYRGLDSYRAVVNQARTAAGLPVVSTPPVPKSVAVPIISKLLSKNRNERDAGAQLYLSLIQPSDGDPTGTALTSGVLSHLMESKDSEVRSIAGHLFWAGNMLSGQGPNAQEQAIGYLNRVLDRELVRQATENIPKMALGPMVKDRSPGEYLKTTLQYVNPSTKFDESLVKTISGLDGSEARGFTPASLSNGVANLAASLGITGLTADTLFEGIKEAALAGAATPGGVMTDESFFNSVQSVMNQYFSAGWTTAIQNGQQVAVRTDVRSNQVLSKFSASNYKQAVSIPVAQAAPQAILDYDTVASQRASIEWASKNAPRALPFNFVELLPFGFLFSDDNTPQGFSKIGADTRRLYDSAWGSKNITGFFNEDWNSPDIDARYLQPAVAIEYGLDVSPVAEKLGVPARELMRGSRWFLNLDGSMARYYLERQLETYGGRTDFQIKKGKPVTLPDGSPVVISRENMAVLNVLMRTQGTKAEQPARDSLIVDKNGNPTGRPTRAEIQLELARRIKAELQSIK